MEGEGNTKEEVDEPSAKEQNQPQAEEIQEERDRRDKTNRLPNTYFLHPMPRYPPQTTPGASLRTASLSLGLQRGETAGHRDSATSSREILGNSDWEEIQRTDKG